MDTNRNCERCGQPLSEAATENICPACLAQLAQAGWLDELNEPTEEAAVQPKESAASEGPGTVIGRYKLLERLGQGGFGVVWAAEQKDPVRRRVALKIIKLGMDTKQVVARFEAERQALALMEHPNIAKVLDAGTTDTGRPYFVMELVKGIRITHYCDQEKLATKDRLDLFIKVCQAIQHAHQKGIIHRDIKPSNILVTLHDGVPVPKVIDFGIAKATQAELTEKTIYTQYGQFIGTPAYMSPEQAEMSGLDIDTRSDIYSLGVMLYELLTGTTPFDTKELLRSGLDEMRRIIRERDPVRPSTRLTQMRSTDPQQIANQKSKIENDLDWIVMKCLEKDRARRYDTANGLAMDIHRHLDNEPILARPPSRLYQFQKSVRRHKVGYAATAAVVVALVIGVVISIWQMRNALGARHEAQVNQANAETAEAVANEERDRAVRTAEELREHAYASDIGLAFEAIQKGDLGYAQTLLNKHLPETGQTDLRGFEWRYLWARSQGDQIANLGRYAPFLSGVALSPDGQFAALRLQGPLRLDWIHLRTGTVVKRLTSARCPLVVSPGGKLLIATQTTNKVVGLDTRTWEAREPLPLTFPLAVGHRTDKEIFVATERDHLSVWSVTDWQKIGDLANTPGSGPLLQPGYGDIEMGHMATCLAVSSDDRFVYLAGAKGIRRWDLEKRIELAPFSLRAPQDPQTQWGEGVSCLATSGEGHLAAGDRWGRIHLIDPHTGQVLHRFESHIGWVACLKFAENGSRLVSAGADRTIGVYDPPQRSMVDRLLGHHKQIWGLDISADGETAISGGGYGDQVLMWSLAKTSGSALDRAGIEQFVVMSDGRIGVHRNGAPDFEYYDPGTDSFEPVKVESFVKALSESRTQLITSSPNARWMVTRKGNTTEVWDVFTAHRLRTLSHETGRIRFARFSPNDEWLATAGPDSEVRVWRTGDWSWEILCPKVKDVWEIQFSRDSRRVAIAERDEAFRVFDLNGDVHQVFEHKGRTTFSVALSSSGRFLASGHADGIIRVWDLRSKNRIAILEGHIQGVFSLNFSPDDRTLASACASAMVKLWHVPTWQPLMSVPADVGFLEFSPDGRYLAVFVLRSGSRVFQGNDAGLRVLKAPTLSEIDARIEERMTQKQTP